MKTLLIKMMREAFTPLADDVQVDRLGNVVASLQGDPDQPHLLIFAHMDELGLIVRKIEPDGFLRFERVGGVPEKSLLATAVEVITEAGNRVPGLVGTTSHHVTPAEAKFTVPSRLEMYVDVGCATSEEVQELGIQVGDMIAYRPGMIRLAGQRVASKTLDNRIGCLQLIKVLEASCSQSPEGDGPPGGFRPGGVSTFAGSGQSFRNTTQMRQSASM